MGMISRKKWIDRGSYSKLILFDKKDLKANLLVQIVKVKPKSNVDLHYHKQTKEIFYVLKGSGTLILSNKKFKIRPGKIFLCRPNELHGVINKSKKEISILVIKINPKEKNFYKN